MFYYIDVFSVFRDSVNYRWLLLLRLSLLPMLFKPGQKRSLLR